MLAVEHWPAYSPKWPHQLLYSRQDNKVWSLHMCACSWALTSIQPKVATPTTGQQKRQQGVKFTHVCLQLSTDQHTAQSGHANYWTADNTTGCEVDYAMLPPPTWEEPGRWDTAWGWAASLWSAGCRCTVWTSLWNSTSENMRLVKTRNWTPVCCKSCSF